MIASKEEFKDRATNVSTNTHESMGTKSEIWETIYIVHGSKSTRYQVHALIKKSNLSFYQICLAWTEPQSTHCVRLWKIAIKSRKIEQRSNENYVNFKDN